MSRIGDFADDDVSGFAVKSPDLGTAMAKFSQAVYTKGRLPLRVREAARIVIAHANECVVCQNTRDADGQAAGVDEELYDHATEWQTWPGYSDAERIAMEFAAAGHPIVVVNPAFPFGERDIAPTPTGEIILSVLRGEVPALSPGGFCAVDVEDVAKAHVAAETKGQIGER